MFKREARKPWTDAEISIIKEFYGSEGSDGVMERTGRPRKGVQQMACRLGLAGVDPQKAKYLSLEDRNKRVQWTEQEREIIREYYPSSGPAGCALYLMNRTPKAISCQAGAMGITFGGGEHSKYHKAFMSWLFGQPGELRQSIGVMCV